MLIRRDEQTLVCWQFNLNLFLYHLKKYLRLCMWVVSVNFISGRSEGSVSSWTEVKQKPKWTAGFLSHQVHSVRVVHIHLWHRFYGSLLLTSALISGWSSHARQLLTSTPLFPRLAYLLDVLKWLHQHSLRGKWKCALAMDIKIKVSGSFPGVNLLCWNVTERKCCRVTNAAKAMTLIQFCFCYDKSCHVCSWNTFILKQR